MRKNLRATLLATGILSLLNAGAFAAESRLDALVARLQRADAAGRRQIMKSLSKAERKQLHAEYRALSPQGKQAVDAALGRGKAKSGGKAAGGRGKAPKGCSIGCIQYDTGTPHILRDNWGSVVGNNFNTGFGNPHTICAVSFQMNGTFAFTPVRIYGAPMGGVAPVLAQTTFTGLPIGTLVTWDLPDIVNHNGPFLGGVEQSGSFSTINSTFVGIDVDINNGGVGFHGMNINLNGSGFNPNATVGGQPFNAIFRAYLGTLRGCIPVELMNFDVQ
jgi:hypothetical protein